MTYPIKTFCECAHPSRPISEFDEELGWRCVKCGHSLLPRRWAIIQRLQRRGYEGLPRR